MVREHRVTAFCDWLGTISPEPPFYTRPEARFFSDLTEAEIDAAGKEMVHRAQLAGDEAEALAGYRDGRDLTTPEPSENRTALYRHCFKVGRAEKQGDPIPAALSRREAIVDTMKDAKR